MNDIIDFIEDLKSKPLDYSFVAWRTFCMDIHTLTDVQKEVIRAELLRRHEDASLQLAEEYDDARKWFEEGARRQGVLDEGLYNQLQLLALSFV